MNLKNGFKQIKTHTEVLLRGLGRTFSGALNAFLIGAAIYGFALIKGEGGYAAVFDFIASAGLLVIAFFNIYMLGSKRKGGKK